MEDTVKGSQLKKIGESVARFADVRTTAKEPQDRIVIQANGETLKIVAGSAYGTLIATAHATTQTFRAIVNAREFLLALKDVSTKLSYKIIDLNLGWEVGCTLVEASSDLRLRNFQRISKKLPVLLLPPGPEANVMGTVQFDDADSLEEFGKMMGSVPWKGKFNYYYNVGVSGIEEPDQVVFGVTDNFKGAIRGFKGKFDVYGRMYPDFLEAIRGIGPATMELYDSGLAVVYNDTYKCIGRFDPLETASPTQLEPKRELENIAVKTVVDRASFVKSLREQGKFDKDGKVGLQLVDNAIIVKPFDKALSGWHVNSKYLLDVLTATSKKQVGIGLRYGRLQPINVRIPEWTIEVMPIDLTRVQ